LVQRKATGAGERQGSGSDGTCNAPGGAVGQAHVYIREDGIVGAILDIVKRPDIMVARVKDAGGRSVYGGKGCAQGLSGHVRTANQGPRENPLHRLTHVGVGDADPVERGATHKNNRSDSADVVLPEITVAKEKDGRPTRVDSAD
jgi:hypothetical protein